MVVTRGVDRHKLLDWYNLELESYEEEEGLA